MLLGICMNNFQIGLPRDSDMTTVPTIAIAKARPFENWTIWNPILKNPYFKCFQILNGRIWDTTEVPKRAHSGPLKFRALKIWDPTVAFHLVWLNESINEFKQTAAVVYQAQMKMADERCKYY